MFIGSVESSKVALETLIENKIKIDLVCSLSKEVAANVSDYYPIHRIAAAHNIPYVEFTRINSPDIVSKIKTVEPDFIFVIGLSQIIEDELLNVPKEYIIGFHPTPLPKHREGQPFRGRFFWVCGNQKYRCSKWIREWIQAISYVSILTRLAAPIMHLMFIIKSAQPCVWHWRKAYRIYTTVL